MAAINNLIDNQPSTCGDLIASGDPLHSDAFIRYMLPSNKYVERVTIENQVTENAPITVSLEIEDNDTQTCVSQGDFRTSSTINCPEKMVADYVHITAPVNHLQICGDIKIHGGGLCFCSWLSL